MSDIPICEQLISERLGRRPTEFEGHDIWDDSDEAKQAYARGVAGAEKTSAAFWGRQPSKRARRNAKKAAS